MSDRLKAVTVSKSGPDARLVLAQHDEPEAGPDEAIVSVRAFSLNNGEVRGALQLLEELTRPEGAADGSAILADLARRLSNGRLHPVIGKISPWAQTDATARELLERKFAGKAVLTVGG